MKDAHGEVRVSPWDVAGSRQWQVNAVALPMRPPPKCGQPPN